MILLTAIVNNDEGPTEKPAEPAKCGWTSWMSGHSPSPSGETETVTALRKSQTFCATQDITAIECQPVGGQVLDDHVQVSLLDT